MKKSLLGFLLLAICSCNKSTNSDEFQDPASLYTTAVYKESDIKIVEVSYTTRPNFKNLQYTSEKTKQQEMALNSLTAKMDIYLPPNASVTKKQPLLVMIHGGGFSSGDKDAWKNEAFTYSRAGYICASINYRLTHGGGNQDPQLRLYAASTASEDAQNAIRFLKKNADQYFIDTSRIVVFGGSAGGVLSLYNAVEYDMSFGTNDFPGISSKTNGSIATGANLTNNDPASQLSQIRYDAFDSPVLLFHAKEYDSSSNGFTWTQNAVPTYQAIVNSGNTCTLVAQPNMTHTVNLELGGDYWLHIKPFLWKYLSIDKL